MTETAKGMIEELKEATMLTITDTQELAVERLKDIAGDTIIPKLDRLVAHGVEQVEARALEATKGLAKEDLFISIVMPVAEQMMDAHLTGLSGSLAKRAIRPMLEDALRGMARGAVEMRNKLFSKSWSVRFVTYVHTFEDWIEKLLGIDLNKDGKIGGQS